MGRLPRDRRKRAAEENRGPANSIVPYTATNMAPRQGTRRAMQARSPACAAGRPDRASHHLFRCVFFTPPGRSIAFPRTSEKSASSAILPPPEPTTPKIQCRLRALTMTPYNRFLHRIRPAPPSRTTPVIVATPTGSGTAPPT